MKPTIKEVAKKAAVSIATVSRALSNSGLVAEATRDRIRQIAEEIHYTPNVSARSLSTNRTDTIVLVLPDLFGEFFSEVIRGADQRAQQHNYHLLVSSSHNNKGDIESALHSMRGRVDGIVIMSPNIDAHTLESSLPKSLPVVLLNCSVDGERCDSINIDDSQGAYQVVRHLISHGHRRIAIIKGTPNNLDAEERLLGYRKAVSEGGGDISEELEVDGNFTELSGQEAVTKILGLNPRPTAIFASNDSMAIGAISALRKNGIQVPTEMAIAGFDDIPVAEYLRPSLTTARIAISELGAMAVETLVNAVKERNAHTKKQLVLQANLVVRESCGCSD
ncbi:MAG: LacI family DNA-binding transcriptional regulator [Ignavibacteriales bacterium]|nr:LacI family DNA-binding transcriptional regulator [Ignavibacteriales bacterium]